LIWHPSNGYRSGVRLLSEKYFSGTTKLPERSYPVTSCREIVPVNGLAKQIAIETKKLISGIAGGV